jgi:uncharacterized protein YaeQ
MHAERREYRLVLSNVDRGISLPHGYPLVLSRHPSETLEHLTLRVLAWALFYEERLEFGPGVCVGDAPDLVATDLIGKTATWIEVGDVSPSQTQRILQHNRQAAVHVVFGDPNRREAFLAEVDSWGSRLPRGWDRLSLWSFDAKLVAALAANESLRQRWTITVVGDHVYVDTGQVVVDGPIRRG